MAGDWLKFEKSTLDKLEVLAIAAALDQDSDWVVGKLIRMWSWFDTHTVDGDARGVTPALLDSILRVTGFVAEVQKAGWLEVFDWGIRLPKFSNHCGETAKKRALGAKRNAAYRESNAKGDATSVTGASPREEKRREEKKKQKPPSSTAVDGFVEFWAAYPRKVGKADAVKTWGKIKPDPETVKDIVAAIAVQSESEQWTKHNGEFIPHPATWLNGRRWEDEGITPAQHSAGNGFVGTPRKRRELGT